MSSDDELFALVETLFTSYLRQEIKPQFTPLNI